MSKNPATANLALPLNVLGSFNSGKSFQKAMNILDTAVGAVLHGTKTWDIASTVDGAQATTTVTVTGAALGDFVQVALSVDLSGATLTGYVSAADTVTAVYQNESGATKDPASATLNARVTKA